MMMIKIMFDQLVTKLNGIEGKIFRTTELIDKLQYDTEKQNMKKFKILVQKKLILLI